MKWVRLLAALLAALMLCGCGTSQEVQLTPYSEIEYQRPDIRDVEKALDKVCQLAAGEDGEKILEAVYAFYDEYDWFYTNHALADIGYSADLTDIFWEKEYGYCLENSMAVDAALDEMYYALADSPARTQLEKDYFGEGFFLDYEGESYWDETFMALAEEEARLQSEYYALSEKGLEYEDYDAYYDACAEDMAALLAQLIDVRQELADYWGYDSYPQLAGELYYYRDYTQEQIDGYLAQIKQELVPLYRQVAQSDVWEAAAAPCSEKETLQYVKNCARRMGGNVWTSFQRMEDGGLYDIAYGENKYNSSFETYLTWYWEPFIFMNPTLTVYDQLTLAHEFGHFCHDDVCWGSYAGLDVLEFFSQGMEYLSLCYGDDTEELTRIKMADSLSVYVEQAAFASFEQRMYELEEPTAEMLYTLYEEVALEFGLDAWEYDRREFVDITHFYTNPAYIISYVISNDAAMQLYQLEQAQTGAGRKLYEENLASQESYFLTFLETAGLESPFAEGRVEAVRETFEQIFRYG